MRTAQPAFGDMPRTFGFMSRQFRTKVRTYPRRNRSDIRPFPARIYGDFPYEQALSSAIAKLRRKCALICELISAVFGDIRSPQVAQFG